MLTDVTAWWAPSGLVKAVLDEAVEMFSGDLPEFLDELEQEVSAIPAEELPLSPFVGRMDSLSCYDFGIFGDAGLGMQKCLEQASDQYPTVVEEIQNESIENTILNTTLTPGAAACALIYEDNAGIIGLEASCVTTRSECKEAGGDLAFIASSREECLARCGDGGPGSSIISYDSSQDAYYKQTCVDINDMGNNIVERVSPEVACSSGFVEACNSDPGDGDPGDGDPGDGDPGDGDSPGSDCTTGSASFVINDGMGPTIYDENPFWSDHLINQWESYEPQLYNDGKGRVIASWDANEADELANVTLWLKSYHGPDRYVLYGTGDPYGFSDGDNGVYSTDDVRWPFHVARSVPGEVIITSDSNDRISGSYRFTGYLDGNKEHLSRNVFGTFECVPKREP